MEVLIRDLYCYECSLQLDKKYVFDVHLSFVHGEKLDIKQKPDSQLSVMHEEKELEIKDQDEHNNHIFSLSPVPGSHPPEARYSGTELVMLYDYKAQVILILSSYSHPILIILLSYHFSCPHHH